MTDEERVEKLINGLNTLVNTVVQFIVDELQKDFAYPDNMTLCNDILNVLMLGTAKTLSARHDVTKTPLLNIIADYCQRLEKATEKMENV